MSGSPTNRSAPRENGTFQVMRRYLGSLVLEGRLMLDQRTSAIARTPSMRRSSGFYRYVAWMIPGTINHTACKKWLADKKRITWVGTMWDVSQIILSVIACVMYIAESYSTRYSDLQLFYWQELILTQFFLVDFLLNWFLADSTSQYFTSFMTFIDILTIAPVYVSFATGDAPNFAIFRFIRILRLVRILRTFRILGGMSGIRRQLITLSLTLLSLTFLAAGVFNVMENEVRQLNYSCKYINEATNYQPSCDPHTPTYNHDSCDCAEHNCVASYSRQDAEDKPSRVSCDTITFFDAYYFIIVTISTVGYGDIQPSTVASRGVMVLFIITSLIVIPAQVNKVTSLLSATSIFRSNYSPQNMEEHVIICGHLTDRRKLERFLREFFHPDRNIRGAAETHLVLLGPNDPAEDVRELLLSPMFDSRVTYLTGTPLNPEDLERARADIAVAIFFLSNSEAREDEVLLDGTALVLNVLAVTDYNPNVNCLVQVVQKHDSDILKNSDIDVVICLEEFKTVVLGRNAVCHGLSTLVDNLFHTFGGLFSTSDDGHWLSEYHNGASIEVYYIPLPKMFLDAMDYEWSLMVEGIFVEFDSMLIGVVDTSKNSVFLNASDSYGQNIFVRSKRNPYFAGILLTSSQDIANDVARGLNDPYCIERIQARMVEEEARFSLRQFPSNTLLGQKMHQSRGNVHRDSGVGNVAGLEFREILRFMRATSKNAKPDIKARKRNSVAASSGSVGEDSYVSMETNHHNRVYDSSSESAIQSADMQLGSSLNSPAFIIPEGALSEEIGKINNPSSNTTEVDPQSADKGIIQHALNIVNHIIVFGCMDHLQAFIEYAQTPNQFAYEPLPIVVVTEQRHPKWALIRQKHKFVYFLQGSITTRSVLSLANVNGASAVVMLASRETEEDKSKADHFMDFESLFIFLKLSSYIPPNVFFVVELTCTENMAVLNSAAIRKEKRIKLENRAAQKSGSLMETFYSINLKMRRMVKEKENSQVTDLDRAISTHDFRRVTHNPQQKVGVFSSQYVDKLNHLQDTNIAQLLSKNAGRRLSSVRFRQFDFDTKGDDGEIVTDFWDNLEAHINLPIFASGRAFVPNVVDNLLCQSFFSSVTPNLCEALVCGQRTQTMYKVPIPTTFVDRYFCDLYRAFASRNVLILGIYRAPQMSENSIMPFVFTCPPMKTVLHVNDCMYAFASPEDLKKAEILLKKPFSKRGNAHVVVHDEQSLGHAGNAQNAASTTNGPSTQRRPVY